MVEPVSQPPVVVFRKRPQQRRSGGTTLLREIAVLVCIVYALRWVQIWISQEEPEAESLSQSSEIPFLE